MSFIDNNDDSEWFYVEFMNEFTRESNELEWKWYL